MRIQALTSVLLAALIATIAGCRADARPSYDPCDRNADCANGDSCVLITYGTTDKSMCTRQRCVVDNDCALDARGTAGACLSFPGGLPTCFERCAARANCAEGWSCESVSQPSGDMRVCVPVP